MKDVHIENPRNLDIPHGSQTAKIYEWGIVSYMARPVFGLAVFAILDDEVVVDCFEGVEVDASMHLSLARTATDEEG
jgi:hypothetical protein